MNKNEYAEEIVKGLEEVGIHAIVRTVVKNNGLVFTGIETGDKTAKIRPTYYIDEYFKKESSVEYVVNALIQAYKENGVSAAAALPPELVALHDSSITAGAIYPRLINAGRNTEYLKDVPHVIVNDLAIVFYINIESMGGIMIITNTMQERVLKMTTEELYEHAKANIGKIITVTPIGQCIDELMGNDDNEDANETGLQIIGIKGNLYGAAAAFACKDVLEKMSEKNDGSDIILIPSSIHEMLAMSDSPLMDTDTLQSMIQNVNSTEVDDAEQLSDHAYIYRCATGEIENY